MTRKDEWDAQEQVLRDLIQKCHEATKDLNRAVAASRRLSDQLIDRYQAIHDREVKSLANVLAAEQNQIAADLNKSVRAARRMIIDQLTIATMTADPDNGTVHFTFPSIMFDENQPMPYPGEQAEEKTL